MDIGEEIREVEIIPDKSPVPAREVETETEREREEVPA